MGEIRFIPFGEFRPDVKEFGGETGNLVVCRNVIPLYGGYSAAPVWETKSDALPAIVYGLHTHATGYASWKAYTGSATKLYEIDPSANPWSRADKTRLGGNYNTTGTGGENGWQAISFGESIIFTNYVDDPQLLLAHSTANFEKLAQSGGANPGMDPKAKFVYAIRGNLGLANLNLSAPFDGLPAGANPLVVAWSQTENIRQFGSLNTTPQLIGAGYQIITNDFGHITGAAGAGDFAIIAQQRALSRQDGSSSGYSFRTVVRGIGCRFPNSIVEWDSDIYLWAPFGPARLVGGEGPLEYLGIGSDGISRIVRSLIDNSSGFSDDSILSGIDIRNVSAVVDYTNGCVVWEITTKSRSSVSGTGQEGNLTVWWNRAESRFSFVDAIWGGVTNVFTGCLFLVAKPDTGETWLPGRDIVGIVRQLDDLGLLTDYVSRLTYSDSVPFNLSPRLGRAYTQFEPDASTRLIRVRPVYAMRSGVSNLAVKVTIRSKNRPFEAPPFDKTYGPGVDDGHGWINTVDTVFADFHQTEFRFDAVDMNTQAHMATQIVGYEADVARGGRYAK